jgi:hypothetical protein
VIVEVCENHPRRTRVALFVYVDGHGVKFERHYCAECVVDVVEDEPRWKPFADGFIWVQEPCSGGCGAGWDYHRAVRVA